MVTVVTVKINYITYKNRKKTMGQATSETLSRVVCFYCHQCHHCHHLYIIINIYLILLYIFERCNCLHWRFLVTVVTAGDSKRAKTTIFNPVFLPKSPPILSPEDTVSHRSGGSSNIAQVNHNLIFPYFQNLVHASAAWHEMPASG